MFCFRAPAPSTMNSHYFLPSQLYLDDEEEEELNNLSNNTSSSTGAKAPLEIEIIDPKNEKKFETLAKTDEKLKTYKRKHSGDLDTPTKRANDGCEGSGDEKEEGELDASWAGTGVAGKVRYWKTADRNRVASESSEATSATSSRHSSNNKVELETDPEVLARRQKQIDFGRNTVGYDNYRRQVPKNRREPGQPKTPNMQMKYSRRAWDGLIKMWRKKLHDWDDSKTPEGEEATNE